MAAAMKPEAPHAKESPLLAILSGWGQQAVQTLFATQHILLDLAMRQNASTQCGSSWQIRITPPPPFSAK